MTSTPAPADSSSSAWLVKPTSDDAKALGAVRRLVLDAHHVENTDTLDVRLDTTDALTPHLYVCLSLGTAVPSSSSSSGDADLVERSLARFCAEARAKSASVALVADSADEDNSLCFGAGALQCLQLKHGDSGVSWFVRGALAAVAAACGKPAEDAARIEAGARAKFGAGAVLLGLALAYTDAHELKTERTAESIAAAKPKLLCVAALTPGVKAGVASAIAALIARRVQPVLVTASTDAAAALQLARLAGIVTAAEADAPAAVAFECQEGTAEAVAAALSAADPCVLRVVSRATPEIRALLVQTLKKASAAGAVAIAAGRGSVDAAAAAVADFSFADSDASDDAAFSHVFIGDGPLLVAIEQLIAAAPPVEAPAAAPAAPPPSDETQREPTSDKKAESGGSCCAVQ